jgi:hypothetical protein
MRFPLFPMFLMLAVAVSSAAGERGLSAGRDGGALEAGCNAGACHGNGQGKGGFKLSLRGQDPDFDWQSMVQDQGGRRVNTIEPERSLLLLKATAAWRTRVDAIRTGIARVRDLFAMASRRSGEFGRRGQADRAEGGAPRASTRGARG